MNRTSRLHDSRGNSPALGAVPVATRKNPRRQVEGERRVLARVLPVKGVLPPLKGCSAPPSLDHDVFMKNKSYLTKRFVFLIVGCPKLKE